MPIGYLIPALLVLLSAYFVLAPASWPRLFRFWWVGAGLINELPFFALLFLVANTALAISQGDLFSTGGWVAAFGCNIAAAMALLVMFYLSLQTSTVTRRSLKEALGDGWDEKLSPKLVTRLRKNFSAKALLGPFVRSPGIKHIRNISYGTAGKYNTLDIYRKEAKPHNAPIFIYIHGGALRNGKKDRTSLPVLYHLASQGWVCLSANYRLQPYASFDEQMDDIRNVVSWVKAHSTEHGGDPNFVMIGGGSSGGQLAALIGLEKPKTVSAVVALYGQFFYGPAEQSPSTYVHKDAPPFLVLHGDRDNLIPATGARRFVRKLQIVSKNPVAYIELPNAEHNFDQFNSVRSQAAASAIEAFGAWCRKGSM